MKFHVMFKIDNKLFFKKIMVTLWMTSPVMNETGGSKTETMIILLDSAYTMIKIYKGECITKHHLII